MALTQLRQLALVLLPLALIISTFINYSTLAIFSQWQWRESFYILSLTANIGYFTNFIAIKMLFKPYHPTAFGRQGLIPKNQDKLAVSLSETLTDNFLSHQQWKDYLIQSNIFSDLLSDAHIGSKHWLESPQNITLVTTQMINYLKKNEAKVDRYLNQLQNQLIAEFASNLDAQKLLSHGFEWLDEQFEKNPTQLKHMIEPIIKTVAENIPAIAHGLDRALDSHIEEQDTLKRGIAKVAKWSADFSSEDIKNYLFRMVASFEFRETLFEGLKKLASEYKEQSSEFIFSKQINTNHKEDISSPSFNQLLLSINQDPINWTKIITDKFVTVENVQNALLGLHGPLFALAEKKLTSEKIQDWTIDKIVLVIENLNLKKLIEDKASKFSPKKLENLFQSMISEQLIFIELLGALLGALSGLALIDVNYFMIFSGLIGGYFLLDKWLTNSPQ